VTLVLLLFLGNLRAAFIRCAGDPAVPALPLSRPYLASGFPRTCVLGADGFRHHRRRCRDSWWKTFFRKLSEEAQDRTAADSKDPRGRRSRWARRRFSRVFIIIAAHIPIFTLQRTRGESSRHGLVGDLRPGRFVDPVA